MAEVIVISAIILGFMTGLYISYNKLFSLYNIRIDYYDSTTLYELVYYRDMLIKENKMNTAISDAGDLPIEIFDGGRVSKLNNGYSSSVYLIHNRKNSFNVSGASQGFSDYIDYLATAITFNTNYMMVMERCLGQDDCTYAYLEVYDGYE